jgi:hypothetical protein
MTDLMETNSTTAAPTAVSQSLKLQDNGDNWHLDDDVIASGPTASVYVLGISER